MVNNEQPSKETESPAADSPANYWKLAETARTEGHMELADRFDEYAQALEGDSNQAELDGIIEKWTTNASLIMRNFLDNREERYSDVTAGFAEWRVTQAVLADIHTTLFGRKDLGDIKPRRVKDRVGDLTDTYLIPLDYGIHYSEVHTFLNSPDEDPVTLVEVQLTRPDLLTAGASHTPYPSFEVSESVE